jgi:hypothetical protein
VEEAEYALELDTAIGTWTMLDIPASQIDLGDERRRILEAVRETPGLGPKAIAERSGLSYDVVKQLVRRMAEAAQLDTDGNGHYSPPFTLFTAFTQEDEQ